VARRSVPSSDEVSNESERENSLLERYGQARRRPPVRPLRRWLVVTALIVAAGGVSVAAIVDRRDGTWQPPSGTPRFAACTYGGQLDAWCGRVTVPEDPTRAAGRRISLRVAVIPATKQPSAGAFFYLDGGPGGAATDEAVSVNELFATVSATRDIVLVDQRGTGGSHAIRCPQEHVRATDAAAVTTYLHRCFAGRKADVRFYTTAAAMDDIDAVRHTLGYGPIDVYGGSYGATAAQILLRRHPAAVRTVILDGASLLDVPLNELSARNAERALRTQLARCAADVTCHRRYPRTRTELAAALARRPHRVRLPYRTTVLLDRDAVALTINLMSRTPDDVARIPSLVHATAAGDDAPLAEAYADHVSEELGSVSRLAMFWVIQCSEPWARYGVAATARASGGSYFEHVAIARARFFRRVCAVVPKGLVPARSGHPPRTRVPVLLLAGGADPQDPPENLAGWRSSFPNGRLVVALGVGHGAVEHGCLPLVAAAFVDRGTARGLDTSCARRIRLPPFETGP
jgi:pimeloyl-ACP methyl ester carboxylesterase